MREAALATACAASVIALIFWLFTFDEWRRTTQLERCVRDRSVPARECFVMFDFPVPEGL